MKYTQEEVLEILKKHRKLRWTDAPDTSNDDRANLRYADLSNINLSGINLSCADLIYVDFTGANLSGADLRNTKLSGVIFKGANLSNANLGCTDLSGLDLSGVNFNGARLRSANFTGANLSGANFFKADLGRVDFSGADLSGANFFKADLSYVDFSDADLSGANLFMADLSNAKGLLNPIEYIEKNFEKTKEGIIAYKSFGVHYTPNPNWEIAEGSIIEEVVNPLPTVECGCGINVATKEWAKNECFAQVWKCLIKWEWLAGVVVPYQTVGQIRASKVQLIEPVEL